jgi:hypothetical protein
MDLRDRLGIGTDRFVEPAGESAERQIGTRPGFAS